MAHKIAPSPIEAYVLVTSDNRRFIVETADPKAERQNFPVPGETIKIVSMTPLIKHERWLTVHELAASLADGCSKPPHWRTLMGWAQAGQIPYKRIGQKFMRFVEADVRRAMNKGGLV